MPKYEFEKIKYEIPETILEKHNPLEEGPGAVYEECEQLLGAEIDAVLGRLTAAPRVRVAPHADSAISFESARIALRKLIQVHRAISPRDLAAVPGNQLEGLALSFKGSHALSGY